MTWEHPRNINRRKVFGPPFTDKHWNDCFYKWLAWLRNQNDIAETALVYERRARRFFKDPAKKPDQYSRQDVESFAQEKNYFTGEKPKANTYNARLAALRSFYKYASSYEYMFRGKLKKLMERTPVTFNMRNLRVSSQSRAMTDTELQLFFRAIEEGPRNPVDKKMHRALYLVYLWSGRRVAEIARLRWANVDVVPVWDERKQEKRDAWIYHWRGKNHIAVDDSTEMPPDAVIAIIDYLEAAGRWENMKPDDPIFPGKWPGSTMHPGSIINLFRRYCLQAGISKTGVHRLRHTAATWRWYETKDIIYIQKFLRHRHLSATRVYVDPEQGQFDFVAARLRPRFSGL